MRKYNNTNISNTFIGNFFTGPIFENFKKKKKISTYSLNTIQKNWIEKKFITIIALLLVNNNNYAINETQYKRILFIPQDKVFLYDLEYLDCNI